VLRSAKIAGKPLFRFPVHEGTVTKSAKNRSRIRRSILLAVPGMLLVGLVTFISFGLHLGLVTVSFFYLVVVVLQSLFGNFFSSAIVSVASFLALNYFFIPPLFSLRVSDASDTLALISFLVASLVITRLTSEAQEAAKSEERQRRQMEHLYALARQLLALQPSPVFQTSLLEPIRSEFKLTEVSLFEADAAKLHSVGESPHHLVEATRDAYISGKDFDDPSCQVAVRLLRVSGRTVGSVGFVGLRDHELTAGPLSALIGLVLERCDRFAEASRATAAVDAEVFRGAVLDALAHEFKTPLATILTAASGLSEIGQLKPGQIDLVRTVESETQHLSQLTSRLLCLARLEREDVKPQMELVNLESIVGALVEHYSKRRSDHRFAFESRGRIEIFGDRELLWLGLGQLLDNACKYSLPGSQVTVSIDTTDNTVVIHVCNEGPPISLPESSRIFERFYRGKDVRDRTPGSGLGLYVARKIAAVHGGHLDLERLESNNVTAFRFSVARKQKEPSHEPEIQCASR
jgi:two-component system, OmpR family, sensor histidine kinase KdpD